ncbi:AMP-binding protein [Burkholderia sola]|uniref:AMP-binding protein n=1 Tax=Burkholderia sola TaxID=2843302 RepID=UPI00338E8E61
MELPGRNNELVTSEGRWKWKNLAYSNTTDVTAHLVNSQLAGLRAALGHVKRQNVETLIVDRMRCNSDTQIELRNDGFTVDTGEAAPPIRPRVAVPGRLWVLTSGSTGRPKRVPHSLPSVTPISKPQPSRRWLMAYSPGTYAWWQIISLVLTQPGQDLIALDPKNRYDWPLVALDEQVTAITGTPTFLWRAVLHHWDLLCRMRLDHISLGGEPVEQALLDRLREAQPKAKLMWAYGSTEYGLPVVVSDGKAGFPTAWLDQQRQGKATLSIKDNELLIENPLGSRKFDHTGDCVQIVGDRVFIVGRLSGNEINVGGSKITTTLIRQVLNQHPAIAWSRIRARRVPIIGQVPIADVVLQYPLDDRELRLWCKARLPEYGVPRRFEILPAIPETEAGKSDG